LIGETISHYRITGKLGEGGMGVVYQAHDEHLDRDVAIKVLPEAMVADSGRLTRFEHEAKAIAQLAHPNILQVHELGQHEGKPFMVTELLAGQTLRERLEGGGSLGWRQAAEIGAAIADGLAAAHQAGIVHRDLKPSNVFLTSDGRVKVLDFGLALTLDVLDPGDSEAPTLTRCTAAGSVLGTVGYMSPEQVRGEPADGRSDLFALGCVLYEMVSGDRAFCRETGVETMNAILKEEPAEMATAAAADLPPELGSTVRRCLEKNPEARFQSASDLAYNLRTISSSTGSAVVQAPRRGTIRLRPAFWVPLTIAIVAVVAGWLTFFDDTGPPVATERSLAIVNFLDLTNSDDPSGSAGLMGLLYVGLLESSPIRVVSPEHLYDLRRRHFGSGRGPIDDEQALAVAREAGASDLLSGQMGGVDDDRHVTWRLVDARTGSISGAGRADGTALTALADETVVEVLRLLGTQNGGKLTTNAVSVATLTTTSPEAYRHYVAGKLAEEEIRVDDEFRHFMRAVTIDSTFALAHLALSRSWKLTYQRDIRRDHLERAWRHRDKLTTIDRLLLEAWRIVFDRKGDWHAEARRVYEEVLERWPDDRDALYEYADFLYITWGAEEAVPVNEKALSLFPNDQSIRLQKGHILRELARPADALASCREYVKLNPGIGNVWDEIGLCHLGLGHPDSAGHYFRKALAVDPQFFFSRQGLCWAAFARGESLCTIELFKEMLADTTLAISDRRRVLYSESTGIGLAQVYFSLGRFTDYFELVRRETARGTPALHAEDAYWYMDRFDLKVQSADSALAELDPETKPNSIFFELWIKGLSLCRLDSLAEAQAIYDQMHANRPHSGPMVQVLLDLLASYLHLARGHGTAALDIFSKITYSWGYYDIDHRLDTAEALRLAGRHEDAVAKLEELLRVYGGYIPAHYHLGHVYEEMGRPADAKREYEVFLAAWSEADEGLPKLVDAQQRLAGLRD